MRSRRPNHQGRDGPVIMQFSIYAMLGMVHGRSMLSLGIAAGERPYTRKYVFMVSARDPNACS